jgi:hypothetical protein
MPIQLKIIDLFFTLILLSFAVIQLNDPDPLFWFGLYGIAALAPLLTLFRPFSASIFWLAAGYCLAGIAQNLGGGLEYLQHAGQESLMQEMSPDKQYIEQAREVIGALIALSIISAHYFLHRRHN